VLVPYQGTIHDRAAIKLAQRLAKHVGAEVTILHVVREGRERSRIEQDVGDERVTLKLVTSDSPDDAVIEEASSGYDLVLIGAGQEWGLEHRQFGLSAEKVIRSSPASLLIVRQYEAQRVAAQVPAPVPST
jgi:nucleotide-binding universal stress UspA family protein